MGDLVHSCYKDGDQPGRAGVEAHRSASARLDDHEKHHDGGSCFRAKAVIVRSRYCRSTQKGLDTLVSKPFRACWGCKDHAQGGRKSGRLQPAFPEIHHSPPFGFGAIDPAGDGAARSSSSTRPTSMILTRSSGYQTMAVRAPFGCKIHSGCVTRTREPLASTSSKGRNGCAWIASCRLSCLTSRPLSSCAPP